MLGMDIKCQPIRSRGREGSVALVQLSNSSHCLILQMLYIDRMPEEVAELLENPDVPIGGCGIEAAAKLLESDYGLPCNGLVELGQLAAKIYHNKRWRQADLDEMNYQLVGTPVMKPRRVGPAEWWRQGLGWNQIQLAVLDAWMAFSVFSELAIKATGKAVRPSHGRAGV
ncbi:unnamed protein product [Closterium sp. NIES-54]